MLIRFTIFCFSVGLETNGEYFSPYRDKYVVEFLIILLMLPGIISIYAWSLEGFGTFSLMDFIVEVVAD